MSIYNLYDFNNFGNHIPLIYKNTNCGCSTGGNSDKDAEQDKLISELKKIVEENSKSITSNAEAIQANTKADKERIDEEEKNKLNIYYEDGDDASDANQ